MAGWLMLADRLTDAWAAAMWRACWQGGLALAVVWVWCRVIAPRRTPAKVKCWLWRLAYAKLLVSLVWIAPAALPLLPAHPEPPSHEPPSPAPAVVHVNPAAERQTAGLLLKKPSDTPLFEPSVPALAHVPQSVAGAPKWHQWRAALACLWLIGTALAVLRLAAGWRATVRLRRRCTRVDDAELLERFADLACRYGLRRAPPVMQADAIASPLLLGVWRPLVVLPTGLASSHRPGELRLLLAHELAHLRRRDLLWNALAAAAQAAFWFHPLVWLARREWRLAQEVACDEAAVAVTRVRTADYARALLDIVERCAEAAAGQRLIAIGIFENGRTLERRLVAMKHYQNWTGRRRMFAISAVACLAAIGIPSWRLVAQNAPTGDRSAAGQRQAVGEGDTEPSARPEPATRPTRLDAPAATLPAGDDNPTISIAGRISTRRVRLTARTNGSVRSVFVEDGQHVKAGELLVQLDDKVDALQVQAAEADLKQKLVQLRRLEKLYEDDLKRGHVNPEIEEARANVSIAEIAVKYRQAIQEQYRVVAPFDGVITVLRAEIGQAANTDAPLAILVDLDHPRVAFSLSEDMAGRIRTGTTITVTGRSPDAPTLTGKVASISPVVNADSGVVDVVGTLDGPVSGLKPGMFVTVKAKLEARGEQPRRR